MALYSRHELILFAWSLRALCSCSSVEKQTPFYPHRGQPTHQYISPGALLLPPSALPTGPPARVAASRCCCAAALSLLPPPPPAPPRRQQLPCINTHLRDKRSTLSMFSRQLRSHPLAVSQPCDLSVCRLTSLRLHRMPSVLGKL